MESIQKYKHKLVSVIANLYHDGRITKNSKRAFDRQVSKQMSRDEMGKYIKALEVHNKKKKVSLSSVKAYVKRYKSYVTQDKQAQFMKSDLEMQLDNIRAMFIKHIGKKILTKKQKKEIHYVTAVVSYKKRWINKGKASKWYTFTKRDVPFVMHSSPTNEGVFKMILDKFENTDYEEYDEDIALDTWMAISYDDFKQKADDFKLMKNVSEELVQKTMNNVLGMKQVEYVKDDSDVYAAKKDKPAVEKYKSNLGTAEIHTKSHYDVWDGMEKVSAIRINGIEADEKTYKIENDGQCVPELLFYRYAPILKRLTLEKIKQSLMVDKSKMIKTLIKNKKIKITGTSLKYIDAMTTAMSEKIETGHNTMEILSFCVNHQISMYAMDENSQVYCKYLADNQKHHAYPALTFWNIHNHMYLCSDPKFISKVSHSERIQIKNAIIIEEKQIKEDTRDYIDGIPIHKLSNLKDVHLIYQQENFNETFKDLIKIENTMYKTKFIDDNIMTIYYKNNVDLIIDPYFAVTQPGSILWANAKERQMIWENNEPIMFSEIKDKWRAVQDVCQTAKIPFTCQSIGKLCKDLEKQFFDLQKERISLTEEEKKTILKKYKNKCNECNIDNKLEFHHKVRVADGGSNDIENIQVLCKDCHQKKTEDQQEAGEFMSIINSMSFFNKKTKNIIQSQAFKKFAFVEKVYPTIPKENKFTAKQKNKLLGEHNWKCTECETTKLNTNTCHFMVPTSEEHKYNNKKVGETIIEEHGKKVNYSWLERNKPLCYTCHHLLHMKHQLGKEIDISNIIGIDAYRMRKNLMYFAKDPWPVFTIFDDVQPFKIGDELKTGQYLVETNLPFPIRGNEWMSLPKLKYCLDNKIITLQQVKQKFISSLSLPPTFFQKFIDYIGSLNPIMSKFIINSYIGCCAKTEFKYQTCKYMSDYYEVCEEMTKNVDKHKIPPKKIQYGNGPKDYFYQVLTNHKTSSYETELPIYNQILDLEVIELHKLYTKLVANGYPIIEFNTDAIAVYTKSQLEDAKTLEQIVNTEFWDAAKTLPKFKFEKKETLLKCSRMKSFKNREKFTNIKKMWNITEDVKNDDFTPIIKEVLESNKGCLLQGPAGSGKTYLLKLIIEELKAKKLNHILLAPTNKACRHLGKEAMTCHKLKLRNLRSNSTMLKRLNFVDYIIVDEISMVKEPFYIIFQSIKDKFPNIKFIISGDFNQLLPVAERIEFNYEDSNILKELCDCHKVQLSKIRRCDPKIVEIGNEIIKNKNISLKNFPYKMCYRHICYTNKKRNELNYRTMNQFINDTKCEVVELGPLKLSVGMPIICVQKNKLIDIRKNEIFIIDEIIHDNYIQIIATNEDDKEHCIMFELTQFIDFFDLAFCITSHKSQGCTFKFDYMIHEWNHQYFDWRAKYVVLTRAKHFSQININPCDIVLNELSI